MRLIVRNGLVVTPTGVVAGGLVCEDGVIIHVGPGSSLPSDGDMLDADGKWVIPGVIDPHTHIGTGPAAATMDRIRSAWESESRAAIHKGVTTIVSFQGGSPIPMSEPHVPMLEQQITWAEEVSYADFAFHAIMQTEGHLDEQEELARRGVVGFKHFYTAYKPGRDATADQISIGYADDGMLYDSFERLGRLRREGANVLGMIHAEDADICALLEGKLKAAGRTDLAAWAEGRPNLACLVRSQSAAEIAQITGCPLYIVHITTAEEVDLVRRLKHAGVPVYGETVVHYLTHTKDMEERHGCYPKVIPAIKSAADREALWHGLADGTLTTLGTDHCAWTKTEKLGPSGRQFGNIWDALPGMTGMEYLLPAMLTFGVRTGRLTLEQTVRIMSENPARRFGLYPRKGVLQPGSDADFVIVDPDRRATVTPDYHEGSIADWSIYENWEFCGMPETTVVRGEVVVERGEVVGTPGHGTYAALRGRTVVAV
jgi:dihydroorotase-like cyclic amidohydrolase